MRALTSILRTTWVLFLLAILVGCDAQQPPSDKLYGEVDSLLDSIRTGAAGFSVIAEIDHSRLAAKEGEVMPPARVLIFSDPEINSPILQARPLAGLDLPFRALAYAEGNPPEPAALFTDANFLQRRHGLVDGPALRAYRVATERLMSMVPASALAHIDSAGMGEGEGIVTLDSAHDFGTTIERLKSAIMAEGDTIWFGEIDYQNEARPYGVDLPKLTLLLFGAPGPGAKAMAERPRMGLDAFCQKLLVHEGAGGKVQVHFNEMKTFARLHSGSVALPHRVIDRRMKSTLGGAIEP